MNYHLATTKKVTKIVTALFHLSVLNVVVFLQVGLSFILPSADMADWAGEQGHYQKIPQNLHILTFLKAIMTSLLT